MTNFKSAREMALKDITKYINEYTNTLNGRVDGYIVTATYINNKENRYLNKMLGINRINFLNNKNGKK